MSVAGAGGLPLMPVPSREERHPMQMSISLPVADRTTSSAFYRAFLGIEPFGPVADDGEPEPLAFRTDAGTVLMLIPADGFRWVVGDAHEVCGPGRVEALLGVTAATPEEVHGLVERATRRGGTVAVPPGRREWGYTAIVADPDGHLWEIVVDDEDSSRQVPDNDGG
ncbi:MAG: VOC family protein [Phycicoccus sp.]